MREVPDLPPVATDSALPMQHVLERRLSVDASGVVTHKETQLRGSSPHGTFT